MTRDQIVAEARRFLGAPWRRHGRSLAGIDCGGLAFCVGEGLGEKLADISIEARRVPEGETLVCLAKNLRARPPQAMLARGAVALLLNDNGASARHVGIIAERGGTWTLINANASQRKVVEERLDRERLVAAFDFRTVTE